MQMLVINYEAKEVRANVPREMEISHSSSKDEETWMRIKLKKMDLKNIIKIA